MNCLWSVDLISVHLKAGIIQKFFQQQVRPVLQNYKCTDARLTTSVSRRASKNVAYLRISNNLTKTKQKIQNPKKQSSLPLKLWIAAYVCLWFKFSLDLDLDLPNCGSFHLKYS